MDENIELQNQFLELQNKYNELETNHNALKAENEQLKADKIALQTHNQELFIRCTSPNGTQPQNPQINTKTIEEIAKEMRGKK